VFLFAISLLISIKPVNATTYYTLRLSIPQQSQFSYRCDIWGYANCPDGSQISIDMLFKGDTYQIPKFSTVYLWCSESGGTGWTWDYWKITGAGQTQYYYAQPLKFAMIVSFDVEAWYKYVL
jgi:hypothetical protein